jgi:hypothetical protein
VGIEPSYSAGRPRVFTRVGGPGALSAGVRGRFCAATIPPHPPQFEWWVTNLCLNRALRCTANSSAAVWSTPSRGGATVPARRHACPGPRGPGRHAYRHIAQNWAAGGFSPPARGRFDEVSAKLLRGLNLDGPGATMADQPPTPVQTPVSRLEAGTSTAE